MDDSIITNDGEIVLVKINKVQGIYIKIINVTLDPLKKGWWMVKFYPLIPTKDFKLREAVWKLDEQQIRGEEFTMNGIPHQLFKADYEVKQSDERPKYNITNKQDVDAPVPLPEKTPSKHERPYLKLVKQQETIEE